MIDNKITVEVNTEKLVEILKENRKQHRETFEKAVEKYRAEALKWFEQRIQDIQGGKGVKRSINLPEPEEHTSDYDTVIGMLEMHEKETITLGAQEYRNYVEDKWQWSDRFYTNTTSYVR